MDSSRLKVKIYDTHYALKADTSHQYIEKTAAYVDKTMREIASRFKEQSHARIAVLAALNIADELFQIRGPVSEIVETRIKKLTDLLSSALQD